MLRPLHNHNLVPFSLPPFLPKTCLNLLHIPHLEHEILAPSTHTHRHLHPIRIPRQRQITGMRRKATIHQRPPTSRFLRPSTQRKHEFPAPAEPSHTDRQRRLGFAEAGEERDEAGVDQPKAAAVEEERHGCCDFEPRQEFAHDAGVFVRHGVEAAQDRPAEVITCITQQSL